MALTICTGMWGPKRDQYADSFLRAFDDHWPGAVRLHVFSDPVDQGFGQAVAGAMRTPGRQTRVSWMRDCPGWTEFMERHGADPEKWGRAPNRPRPWKPSTIRGGYNFRFDACRFAGQAFIPERAAERMEDGDVLCWLDADVTAFKDVPYGLVESLIGSTDGAYLGRGLKHSEIGFWAVRLNDRTREALTYFANTYRSDALFALKEWHSAYAWDDARRSAERYGLLNLRDLTPGGEGHVFMKSPLGDYLDHLKGDRKTRGRSPERRA